MAKFSKAIKRNSVLPTSIEGIYVKDMTLQELKELQDKLGKIDNEDDLSGPLLILFQDVIRAEDGTVFEDMLDADELSQNISFNLMMDISAAVSEVLGRNSTVKK